MDYQFGHHLDIAGMLEKLPAERVFLLTDQNLDRHYPQFLQGLSKKLYKHVIDAGEQSKNFVQMERILLALSQQGFGRGDLLLSFGGGVVGDLGGLCAGLYMRGMEHIIVPTSIIAMADSAIGGKTAINFNGIKNNIGLFYEPAMVLADTAFLKTLPPAQRRSGLGELLKITLLSGRTDLLSGDIAALIEHAAAYKMALVARDPYDRGERHLLNLGHSLGHVIEMTQGIPHGEAVAMGLDFISRFSDRRGISSGLYGRVRGLLMQCGLRNLDGVPLDTAMLQKLYGDKKSRGGGRIRLALLADIGKPLTQEFDIQEVIKETLC